MKDTVTAVAGATGNANAILSATPLKVGNSVLISPDVKSKSPSSKAALTTSVVLCAITVRSEIWPTKAPGVGATVYALTTAVAAPEPTSKGTRVGGVDVPPVCAVEYLLHATLSNCAVVRAGALILNRLTLTVFEADPVITKKGAVPAAITRLPAALNVFRGEGICAIGFFG